MPLVTFTNPKGGSSKTTSALLLATGLAQLGQKVAIVDADPNAPLLRFFSFREKAGIGLENVSIHGADHETVLDVIDNVARTHDWVVVDTEGTANVTVGLALSRTDLVLIPVAMSRLDVDQAAKAIRLIKTNSKALRRPIAFQLLMTRVNPAMMTASEKAINRDADQAQIPTLPVRLVQRSAYTAIFEHNRTLWELDPKKIGGLERAIENTEQYTRAVVRSVVQAIRNKESLNEQSEPV